MNENEFLSFLAAYEGTQPPELARLFSRAPDQTRAGLELLLQQNPTAFSEMVPQAIDKQTNLFSKEYFEKTLLPIAISIAKEKGISLSYLLLDIDGFHQFNEKYGHPTGDEAIYGLATLLKKSFRTRDSMEHQRSHLIENEGIAADSGAKGEDKRRYNAFDNIARLPDEEAIKSGRVGNGEEFALILYGCDEKTSGIVANRFLQDVRKIRIPYKEGFVGFTVSGGAAQYLNGMTPSQLIENADAALLYSKRHGKDKIITFSQVS